MINIYDILGSEAHFYWLERATDSVLNDFGRFFIWKQPIHWPKKQWQEASTGLFSRLLVKYGTKVTGTFGPTTGPAYYMRQRCYRTQETLEKMTHYYGG